MNDDARMQAIVFDDFGGPEVLVARDVARPEVRPHDLLVRNASIGVNRADVSHRKGAYGRAHFGESDLMGLEIAGTVVQVGAEVQGFAVGDRVMGIVGGGAVSVSAAVSNIRQDGATRATISAATVTAGGAVTVDARTTSRSENKPVAVALAVAASVTGAGLSVAGAGSSGSTSPSAMSTAATSSAAPTSP